MEKYHGSIHMQYYYEGLQKTNKQNPTKPQNQKYPEQSLKKLLILKFSGICSCFTNEAWYLIGILSSLGLNSNHKIKKDVTKCMTLF